MKRKNYCVLFLGKRSVAVNHKEAKALQAMFRRCCSSENFPIRKCKDVEYIEIYEWKDLCLIGRV